MAIFGKLFQRFSGNNESPSVELVPKRFLQVFREHGVEAAQIPRLFPEIRLEALQTEQALIASLDHNLLQKVAEFFGVRLEWLEGVDNEIYEYWESYKYPGNLFEDLAAFPSQNLHYPIRILVNDKNLDRLRGTPQYLVLVVAEKIGELGDLTLERYRIYDNLWDWHHSPCRLQLKAMARLIHNALGIPIPIYEVNGETLEALSERQQFPKKFMKGGFCPSPCLEDFGLSSKESRVAKDTKELSSVYEFISQHGLEDKVKLLKRQESIPDTPAAERQPVMSRQEKARKAANVRNEAANKLKQQFIEQFSPRIEAKEISQAKAAAEFYDKLSEELALLLCRSSKDYQNSSPDELRRRAIRTLTSSYCDLKKPKN